MFFLNNYIPCLDGKHTWTYSSGSTDASVPDGLLCDCGAYRWDSLKNEGVPVDNNEGDY